MKLFTLFFMIITQAWAAEVCNPSKTFIGLGNVFETKPNEFVSMNYENKISLLKTNTNQIEKLFPDETWTRIVGFDQESGEVYLQKNFSPESYVKINMLKNPMEKKEISLQEKAQRFGGNYLENGKKYFIDPQTKEKKEYPEFCQNDQVKDCMFRPDGKLSKLTVNGVFQIVNQDGSLSQEIRNVMVTSSFMLTTDGTLNIKYDRFYISVNAVNGAVNFTYPTPSSLSDGARKKECKRDLDFMQPNESVICQGTYFDTYKQVASNCQKVPEIKDCDCELQDKNETQFLSDLKLKVACETDYDEKTWDDIVPMKDSLTPEESKLWAIRLKKMIATDKNKNWVMYKVLKEKGYLKDIDYLVDLKTSGILPAHEKINLEGLCLSPQEKKELVLKFKDSIDRQLAQNKISFLKNNKNLFTSDQLEYIVTDIADNNVERSVQENNELRDVFSSKLYKFALQVLNKELGLDYHPLNDVTVTQKGDDALVIRVSTEPFKNSQENMSGIHYKVLAKIPKAAVDGAQEFNYDFLSLGKKHQAKIKINPLDHVTKTVSDEKSPNYQEMWSDGVLRGLIVSNETGENGVWTRDAYISYYTRTGCIFEPSLKRVVDTKAYLQSRIQGPDVADYLLKEAHSDGDDVNLMSITSKAEIRVCRKTREDGKKEEVEILFPLFSKNEEPKANEKIQNKDFANWFGQRVKDGKGQLVYINSSCNSKSKAINEIPAVASANPDAGVKLANIASNSLVYFFRDEAQKGISNEDRSNSKKFILEGLRNNLSYESIRQSMMMDPRYMNGSGNQFLFPDEKKYREVLSPVFMTPVNIDVKTYVERQNSKLEEYSLWNY